jgi:hypothetical protein
MKTKMLKHFALNVKYFALLVAIHTAVFVICVVLMMRLESVWFAFAMFLPRYAAAVGTAYLVYRVWRQKCSPFVLPLSLLPLPVVCYLILAGARLVFYIPSDPEGWEIIALLDTVFFSWPCAVLSLGLSIIAQAKKSKEARA